MTADKETVSRVAALAFEAAGFVVWNTGGGCTAWRKDIGKGRYILITDSQGCDHTLGDESACEPGKPDHWLIGLHDDEGKEDGSTCRDGKDSAEALRAVAVITLAITFFDGMSEELPATTCFEIDRRNRTPAYEYCCATHDFCDANMVMATAFETFSGRAVDLESDADLSLWNEALDVAKAHGFYSK